jgi:hypothetical protein
LMEDLFALADKDGDGGVDLGDVFQHLDLDGNGWWSYVAFPLWFCGRCFVLSVFVGVVDYCAVHVCVATDVECGVVQYCRS